MSHVMWSPAVPRPRYGLVLVAVGLLVGVRPASAWLVQLDGESPAADAGRAVVLDAAGDSIGVGTMNDLDLGTSITIVKRHADGQELWRRRLGGTRPSSGEGSAQARAVAVDAVGDVVVAGLVPNLGTEEDVLVAKLAGATGAELWRAVIDGEGHGYDRAVALTVDAAGDVVVAGTLADADRHDHGAYVKLSGTNGAERWRTQVTGSGGSATAAGVALLSGGHIAIAATATNAGSGGDWLLARLDGATGAPLAAPFQVHGGMTDQVNAIAVDRDGAIVAAGKIRGAANDEFAVVKVSAAGTEVWRRLIAGTGNGTDQAYAVAVDFAGDVVAAGVVDDDPGERDILLVKLRWSDGVPLWVHTIQGTAGRDDDARALSVDAGGGVLAGGMTDNAGTGPDFTLVRVARDGMLDWLRALPRPADGERADGVAAGFGGDLAVGNVHQDASGADFRTMRVASPSGEVIWQHDVQGTGSNSLDEAHAVAVDAHGDVVAAGATSNTGSADDFTVVTLDGATGATRWLRRVAGTLPDGSDEATAVAVDPAGDVVAAGSTFNAGTGRDVTVVKFGRADGAERWRALLTLDDDDRTDVANAVAVDPAGDVVAAGGGREDDGDERFLVHKLDGATGGTRWTHLAQGRPGGGDYDEAYAVAIDAARDVVVAGALHAGTGHLEDFAVVKLNGTTGEPRWHALYDGAGGRDEATAVAVDGTGDVIAAGMLGLPGFAREAFVVKLASGDGAERWQYRLDPGGSERTATVAAAAVEATGDVCVAATLYPDEGVDIGVVVKLAGADGAERWRVLLSDGAAGGDSRAVGVAFDVVGDVTAFAWLGSRPSVPYATWLVARLAGTTGAARWSRSIAGTSFDGARPAALALDAGGNPAVAGGLDDTGTLEDFAVAKISARSGADAFCGDGTRDADEACDDGNAAGGDCCSPTCRPLEVPGVCGSPCAAVADCDDGDPCTDDACDATSHCTHTPVTGDAAATCCFARPLDDARCARVPRRLQRMFARAGHLVERAQAATRPAGTTHLYRRAERALAALARAVERAGRSRRPARRLEPACAAALGLMVADARTRVDAATP